MCSCRRLKLDFLNFHKFSCTWTQYFNIKPETLKLLEEYIRNTLQGKSICKDYLDRTLVAQEIRPTVHKLNFMKLKVSIKQKKNFRKFLTAMSPTEDQYLEYTKSYKTKHQENNPNEKMDHALLGRQFSKEKYKWELNPIKNVQNHWPLGDYKLKLLQDYILPQ